MNRFIIGIVSVLFVFTPVTVVAQDVFSARQQVIADHCQSLGTLLDQLQRRDLVSRTNLGREHENIARQIAAFNQRMRHNNLNVVPYEQLLVQLNGVTAQFREAYIRYDDRMNELRQVNCRTEPGVFETKLQETRALRDATEGAISHAAALVSQYRDMLVQMQAQLPDEPGGGQ